MQQPLSTYYASWTLPGPKGLPNSICDGLGLIWGGFGEDLGTNVDITKK